MKRIKSYGRAISEDLANHICPTLRRKPDVSAIHIGTNDIINNDCSNLQINLNKICELVTEQKIFGYLHQRKSCYLPAFTSWQEQYECKSKLRKQNHQTVLENK